MQTLEQQRAKHALRQVETLLENLDHKELVSQASSFPAMIHMNGLGQAATFYRMRSGAPEKLYDALSDWLCRDEQVYAKHQDLIKGITESDMHCYRMAQAEALAYLSWLKKFAKAFANTGDTAVEEAET